MSEVSWRWAFASAIGTSHVRTGSPCQDASDCVAVTTEHGEVLIAVVSDGAGSARRAEDGAALACEVTVREIRSHLERGGAVRAIDDDVARAVVKTFQLEVAALASEERLVPRDFACTLLCSVVGQAESAFFQIGDGAIVIAQETEAGFAWVFWPDQGEYANVTHFATDADAQERLQFDHNADRLGEVAMFSDGLQSLVLQHSKEGDEVIKGVHEPFFERMLAPLRKGNEPGRSPWLSTELGKYLSSNAINSRTDDDKTLVIASRRRPG